MDRVPPYHYGADCVVFNSECKFVMKSITLDRWYMVLDLGQLECSPDRRRGPNRLQSYNLVELVLRERMEIIVKTRYRDPKEFD